jgi:tRNA isopentenyl-2-thiomethyl-A-37 hydroxylase MiaE
MKFSIVFRMEKKKILYSNIDMAEYTLRILKEVHSNPQITGQDFKSLYMEETSLERSGKLKEWIPDFDQREEFYKRRLFGRDYLRDLKELLNISLIHSRD